MFSLMKSYDPTKADDSDGEPLDDALVELGQIMDEISKLNRATTEDAAIKDLKDRDIQAAIEAAELPLLSKAEVTIAVDSELELEKYFIKTPTQSIEAHVLSDGRVIAHPAKNANGSTE